MGRLLRLLAFGGAVALVALYVLPFLSRVGVFSLWPVINRVETGATPEYPALQPLTVALPAGRVFNVALAVARTLPRWTVVKADPATGLIEAEARTRLWRFVDDVTIRVAAKAGRTTVSVISASRVGRGDLGQNARNIRAFLGALRRALGETA
ncbi:MAG: DUF1499 domain-containing protein [candidate division NC10 bacterium]|nr:DUF1499 domain-containing protein [candidate division NC10 bacterium]MBI4392072.1 DUF1499 domain-containing protein [candidate division NC10 bacterium]